MKKLFLIRVISIYVVFSSSEYHLFSSSCNRRGAVEPVVEGEDNAPLLALLSFLPKMMLQFRKLQTDISDSESAACCVRVQLGQSRTGLLLPTRYFKRVERFLAVRRHAEIMKLFLPTQMQ